MTANGRPRRIEHVAIVGAGFAGSLQAINLVRHAGPRATLIERRPEAGRGVAYSAAHPAHLLNVRAGNMSALPDDAGHFARWLAEHRPDVGSFAPRIVYGAYLDALLTDTRATSNGRLDLRHAEAIDVHFDDDGARVLLDDGSAIDCDAVILAPGNLPPHQPAAFADAAFDRDIYAPDPWAADVAEGLSDEDTVLIIGSGLTMIDVALLLEARGFRGRIIAQSRRGLIPRAHGDRPPPSAPINERPGLTAMALLQHVRARSEAIGWRGAVDELRPFTQDIWLGTDIEERKRFLRHLRPWWDVHRHRLAPSVAARIAAMLERGMLQATAGKLIDAQPAARGVTVEWRPRGSDRTERIDVRRIVNCSGPQGDLARTGEPLLRALYAAGTIRPDALHLGIDVNAQSETIDAGGQPNPRLIALGPPTRGTFWEIVAVPDIRMQTWSVARRLSNAQWVGGEGL